MNPYGRAVAAYAAVRAAIKPLSTVEAAALLAEVLKDVTAAHFNEENACKSQSSEAARVGAKKRSAARRPTRCSS